jgi:hypothetical protein
MGETKMRTIACRAATVARSLRIFQAPGFIVRNHILTGPSADIDFPKAVEAGGSHEMEMKRLKPSNSTGLVNQGSQSRKVTNYTIFRRRN